MSAKLTCCLCGHAVTAFKGLPQVWARDFFKKNGPELRASSYATLPDRECPHCKSHERHRLLWTYMSPRLPMWRGGSLLDVGPNTALHTHLLADSGMRYASLGLGKERLTYKVNLSGDCSAVTGVFDVIVCSHVLEHVPSDTSALYNLRGMLRPNGQLLIQVPIWSHRTIDSSAKSHAAREELNGHPDHRRLYGPDIVARVVKAGFTVRTYKPSSDLVYGYGLDPNECLYIATLSY